MSKYQVRAALADLLYLQDEETNNYTFEEKIEYWEKTKYGEFNI